MRPAVFVDGAPADFTSVIAGPAAIVVSVESVARHRRAGRRGTRDAVAVFATCPESTSACVSV